MRSPFNDFAAVWIGKSQNIAIGGVSSFITSASILANYLIINPSDIFNFRIVGDTVFADILINYEIGATALTFENNNLIRYFDQARGGISTGFTRYFANSSVFYVTSKTTGRVSSDEMYENSDLKYAFFENADTLRGFRCFAGLTDTRIYIGNLSILDRIVGSANSPFLGCTNVKVYMPPTAPAITGQGTQFERIDILNTTTPDSISDLQITETGGTFVRLDGLGIANAEFYELWIVKNGVYEFIGEIQDSGDKFYLTNLEENTNYSIKIATCDQYWNGSGFFEDASKQAFSNVINVTTLSLPALFQNAVAYYKLDETSGDAIDIVNGYNGTLFGGVTQGVAGKIGNAYRFTSGRLEIPETFDFIQNTLVFTISFWIKINDLNARQIIAATGAATADKGFNIAFENGVGAGNKALRFVALKGVSGEPVISKITSDNVINDSNYHLVSILGVGNDVEIYVDNVEASYNTTSTFATPFTSLSSGTSTALNTKIGVLNTSNVLPLNADLDEFQINNTTYTAAERSDLYNNGNGITI